MAKTDWTSGSFITAAFQIALSGNDATTGHTHDGTDVDGSCPKINPQSHLDSTAQVFTFGVNATFFDTTAANEEAYYTKVGNLVSVWFPQVTGTHSSSTAVELQPTTTWPSVILPSSGVVQTPMMVRSNNQAHNGSILISTNPSTAWVLLAPNASGVLNASSFDETGKGIQSSTCISYMIV